ncbi:MAG: ABC transporter substrate-binding protein [Anaerocolumna sp.]
MKERMKKFMRAAVIVFFAVFAYGCTSKASDALKTQETSDTADNQTGKPTYGGEINVACINEIDSLDPYAAVAAGTKEIMFNVFEGLVKYDFNGEIKPAIAESYDISEDFKTYTFHIRKNIRFHNGQELTNKDIIFSLQKAINSATAASLKNIESVTEDGDTVIIQLNKPDNDFLAYLTASFCAIIPDNYEDSAANPIGTGPFKLVSYDVQQSLVLGKFKDYWNADSVYLDKVTFKIYSDENSAYFDLLAGNLDLYPAVETEHYDEVKDKFNIVLGYRNIVQLLALNNAVEPFNNPKVREALNYAIDKDQIIDVMSNGYGVKLGSSVIPGYKKYFNETVSGTYQYNQEKAKSLLKEAGYEGGFEFTVRVPSNYTFHVKTAELIVAQLEQIGIKANIEQVEWGVWLDDVYQNRNFEATIIGLTGELSPKDWLSRYESTASNNFINYSSKAYDELYANALKEMGEEQNIADYKELQQILADDSASVFIQDPQFLNVMDKNLAGYQVYPLYVQDMSTVYYIEQ